MKPKQISSMNSLPGPDDITRMTLPNGITVLSRPNFNSPSVVVSGYLQCGSLFDTEEKLGLAYFTSLSLMRGTGRRNFQQIYDTLESAGASLGFSAGNHTTGFSGRALAEDLPMLLDILVETLQQPEFPSDQLERLRMQILTNLAIRAQDTGDVASIGFDQLIYAGHPYRFPEDGYPETVQRITRQDILEFHRRFYGPRDMVVAVVGGVAPDQAVELVEKALGGWRNPQLPDLPVLPPIRPMQETEFQKFEIPGKSQADLVMGAIGPIRLSPDYWPASLGNSVLGQFGMFGRIGDVVREKSGLAYYAYTSLNAGIGPGSWEVIAGVNPANLQKAVDLIRAEIRRYVSEPVSPEELSDSQANFIGRLPLSLESNQGVAGALLNLERYQLGLDYYRLYAETIRSVTPEHLLETARRYLDVDRLAIVAAGTLGGQ